MSAGPFDIDRIQRSEQPAAIVALARAFHDDPLFNFLVPDPLSQARAMLTFIGSRVADAAPLGEVWVARNDASIAGVAVWLPPGAYPRGARRELANYLRDLRSIPRIGRRTLAGMRLESALQRAHHLVSEPHWYLALLGTDPAFQRRGAGSALLTPVLERSDAEGIPAYLETQKPDNVPWYRRHGFEVTGELTPRGAPSMWAMRREPR